MTTAICKIEPSACGISDIGRKRSTNDDHFVIARFNNDHRQVCTNVPQVAELRDLPNCRDATLLMVADGVGSNRYGAYCSQQVLRRFLESITEFLNGHFLADKEIREYLKDTVLEIRDELKAEAEQFPQKSGMATTLTAALILWPTWYMVHVGDSRCYLHHEQTLKQLSVDHSLAESMRSRLPVDQHASLLNLRHVIWNSVSATNHSCIPDVMSGRLHSGDTLVLCTDGLNLHVEDGEIADALENATTRNSVCEQLASLTLERGARDNVSIVTARFSGD